MEDMSDELKEKITQYNLTYDEYLNKNDYVVSSDSYNDLVNAYSTEKYTFPQIQPSSGKENSDIELSGFSDLIAAYYSTIEFEHYLQSTMMPTYTIPETTAQTELLSIASNMEEIALQSLSQNTSSATVETAIKSISQLYVN